MAEETPTSAPEEQTPVTETPAAAAPAAPAAPAQAKPRTAADAVDAAVAGEGVSAEERQAEDPRDRRRRSKSIPAGIAHVKATFNNTQVAIADARGGVISWSSAGRAGFKGSRKSTAFAATMVAQDAARQALAKGMHEVEVRVQGAGAGRESAVRGIQSAGMNISVIKDVTPIPHNGCRARKRRRV